MKPIISIQKDQGSCFTLLCIGCVLAPIKRKTFEPILSSPVTRTQEWRRTVCRDMRCRRVAGRIQCAPSCRTAAALRAPSAPPGLTGTSTCGSVNRFRHLILYLSDFHNNISVQYIFVSQKNIFMKTKSAFNIV